MNYKQMLRSGLLLLVCSLQSIAVPQTVPELNTRVRDVIFINGISNTLASAVDSLYQVREVLPEYRVTVVYNPIGWNDGNQALEPQGDSPWIGQDYRELYLLKTAEECFREDLRSISVPHNMSRPIEPGAARRVKAYLDSILPGEQGGHACGNNDLVANGLVSASDMEATKIATLELIERVKAFGQTIIIAHSQGNLLANLAYASIADEFGNNVNQMVRIVNVANTAEISVHGLDMTHSEDRAISSLRLLPPLYEPAFQHRSTPECSPSLVCEFKTTLPTLGTAVQYGDLFNHGFVDTYLSAVFVPVTNTQGVGFRVGNTTFADRFVDFVAAAADSLAVAKSDGGESNAPPIIGSITPITMMANGENQNLTINGSGFASGNIVQFRSSIGGGTAVWISSVNPIIALSGSQIVLRFNPGNNADTISVRVCRSVTFANTGDCSNGSATISVLTTIPLITTVSALKASFDRASCALIRTGFLSSLARYTRCGPDVVGDFELSFRQCVLRKSGANVTMSSAIGDGRSIVARLDGSNSFSTSFAGDTIDIGLPDPAYTGSIESFNLFVGDIVGDSSIVINVRTNGREIVLMNGTDQSRNIFLGC